MGRFQSVIVEPLKMVCGNLFDKGCPDVFTIRVLLSASSFNADDTNLYARVVYFPGRLDYSSGLDAHTNRTYF